MQTLSKACETILNSANQTTNSLVASQYSSTKKGGLMTITAKQLTQKQPKDNDKELLQFLNHTLNLSVNVQTKSRFIGYGWEPAYTVNVGKMTDKQRLEALEAIESFKQPLETKEILQLMTRLAIVAPEREKSNIDVKARALIWCDELSKYPADVVNKVLKSRYRWFPSLAEVLENCENEVAYRKLIENGIRCYYYD